MKLCVKKIYCRRCNKLVRGREQWTNNNLYVHCSRCGDTIWIKEGITWRYAANKRRKEVGPGQAEGVPTIQQKQKKEV